MSSVARTAYAPFFSVGQFDNTGFYMWNFKGSIDEVRITLGEARYVANFTPPVAAFLEGLPIGRLNGKLSVELESLRDGFASYQFQSHSVERTGYGFNYGHRYGN